jgi:hypothetical protein
MTIKESISLQIGDQIKYLGPTCISYWGDEMISGELFSVTHRTKEFVNVHHSSWHPTTSTTAYFDPNYPGANERQRIYAGLEKWELASHKCTYSILGESI